MKLRDHSTAEKPSAQLAHQPILPTGTNHTLPRGYLPFSRASSSLVSASATPMSLLGRPCPTMATHASHRPGFITSFMLWAVSWTHLLPLFTLPNSSKYHLSGL